MINKLENILSLKGRNKKNIEKPIK